MLTLFMAISQGMDWGIILNSLIGVSETAAPRRSRGGAPPRPVMEDPPHHQEQS